MTKLVYDWLSKVTGRILAWGMLTGVRPTKLAMQKLEAGMSRQDGKKKVTKLVYDWLSKVTGRILAWGMLTGVRPTKLAMQKLEAGMSRKEVCTFLEQGWLCRNWKPV